MLLLTAKAVAQFLGIALAHRVALPILQIIDAHPPMILLAVLVLLSATPKPPLAPLEIHPHSHPLPPNTFRSRALLADPALVLPCFHLQLVLWLALIGLQHRLAAILTLIQLLIQLAAHQY